MEIKELLAFIEKEKVTDEELDTAINDAKMEDIAVPTNLSIENTMAEINSISARLYDLHNRNKRDPMVLHRIVSLLELKTKLLGMSNIKPEMQNIIDSEINIFKRRYVEVMHSKLLQIDRLDVALEITDALAKEGL